MRMNLRICLKPLDGLTKQWSKTWPAPLLLSLAHCLHLDGTTSHFCTWQWAHWGVIDLVANVLQVNCAGQRQKTTAVIAWATVAS